MASNVFLALGSNLGNKQSNLRKAVNLLNENENCKVVKTSSVYRTSPFGNIKQDEFYNAVVEISTTMEARELFDFTGSIEKILGRKKTERWGPREIDIDILFYNQLIYKSDDLEIPHPGIPFRDFVLVPMREISEGFIHPRLNKRIDQFSLDDIENHILEKLNLPLM